jgi:hypothetical protein
MNPDILMCIAGICVGWLIPLSKTPTPQLDRIAAGIIVAVALILLRSAVK